MRSHWFARQRGALKRGTESLTARTARAARWRLVGSGFGAVSQFAVVVLLARLLSPADFGLMSLAFLFLAVVQPLGDLGIGGAIVQRATLSDLHVRTAFTFSVLLGLGGAAVIALTAPLGASVMGDPRVAPVLRGLAASYAAGGMGAVAGALLQRRM